MDTAFVMAVQKQRQELRLGSFLSSKCLFGLVVARKKSARMQRDNTLQRVQYPAEA